VGAFLHKVASIVLNTYPCQSGGTMKKPDIVTPKPMKSIEVPKAPSGKKPYPSGKPETIPARKGNRSVNDPGLKSGACN